MCNEWNKWNKQNNWTSSTETIKFNKRNLTEHNNTVV